MQSIYQVIAVAMLTFITSSSHAQTRPPEIKPPSPFLGVWVEANQALPTCKASDLRDLENDGAIQIHPEKVRHWESSCDIKRMAMNGKNTAKVAMQCAGEGMRWNTQEIWHTQIVGDRKQLVIVVVATSDETDEDGNKVANSGMQKPPLVLMYAGCDR